MSSYSTIIVIAVIRVSFLKSVSLFLQKLKKTSLTHSTSILIAINMKYYDYKISIFKITLKPLFLGSIYPGSC